MCGKGEGKLTGIAPSSEKISPDIITLTSVVTSLERGNKASNKEKIDIVFAEAVSRQIVLPSDSMDTMWEIDLSGMSFPVARAACRYILRRLLKVIDEGQSYQDLLLITGVGKHHKLLREVKNFEDGEKSQIAKQLEGTTALREYVREILREDFQPPIYSTVVESSAGTVTISKEVVSKWITSQN